MPATKINLIFFTASYQIAVRIKEIEEKSLGGGNENLKRYLLMFFARKQSNFTFINCMRYVQQM